MSGAETAEGPSPTSVRLRLTSKGQRRAGTTATPDAGTAAPTISKARLSTRRQRCSKPLSTGIRASASMHLRWLQLVRAAI